MDDAHSYLLFHSIAEVFSVTIAVAIFLLAINARRFMRGRPFLLIIAFGLLQVGLFDLLHALAYRGMNLFPTSSTANLATELWIAGRYVFATSLLMAVSGRRSLPPLGLLAVVSSAISGILLASIFLWDTFPDCYVDGVGLTTFKIASEGVVVGFFVLSGLVLWQRRADYDRRLLHLLLAVIGLIVLSELSFMLYVEPYGVMNLVGHIAKVAAFYLLYRAIVHIGLADPFALLFRDVEDQKAALATANAELEQRVAERTEALHRRQVQLRSTTRQLVQVERRERRNIARLLHEDLAQTLAAIKMNVSVLRRTKLADDECAAHVGELADEAIRFTRTLMSRLTPPGLHEGGLAGALRELADHMGKLDLVVDVEVPAEPPPLAPDVAEDVYHVVRELLTNVLKHAEADHAFVGLRAEDGAAVVEVRDEGRGFDTAALPERPDVKGGFGLAHAREQIGLAGGDLVVTSQPGGGTIATIRVPIADPDGSAPRHLPDR